MLCSDVLLNELIHTGLSLAQQKIYYETKYVM